MPPVDLPSSRSFQDGDTLVPLTDAWDAQTFIRVVGDYGTLRFYKHGPNENFDLLDHPPDPTALYIIPRPRTSGHSLVRRVENIVLHAIDEAGGSLALDAIERVWSR